MIEITETIDQDGNNLSAQEYANIQKAGTATYELRVEKYTPAFSSHSAPMGSPTICDSAATTTHIVVCTIESNNVKAYRLADESDADQSWSSSIAVYSGGDVVSTVKPAVWADPDNAGHVYVAFWTGNFRVYKSTDHGASWASHVNDATPPWTPAHIAIIDDDRVVVAVDTSNRGVLYFGTTAAANVTSRDPEISLPYSITGLDAVEIFKDSVYDVRKYAVIISTDYPPYNSVKAVGDETQEIAFRRQGISLITLQFDGGAAYPIGSMPVHVDVMDRANSQQVRDEPRINYINGHYILAASCYDALTYDSTIHSGSLPSGTRLYWSEDGLGWYGGYLAAQYNSRGFRFLALGSYVYMVDSGVILRSAMPRIIDDPTPVIEATDYSLSVQTNYATMRQSGVRLDDPSSSLFALLNEGGYYSIDYFMGQNGQKILTSREIVDVFTKSEDGGIAYLDANSRGFVSFLTDRYRAAHCKEWRSAVYFYDPFEDIGGVAAIVGTWDVATSPNRLRCANDTFWRYTVFTHISDAIDYVYQAKIKMSSQVADKVAGLTFHFQDRDNCYMLRYCHDDTGSPGFDHDDLYLVDVVDGVANATLMEASLGWSKNTWYWLRVVVRGTAVYCYYSTDGVTWTEATNSPYTMPGLTELTGPEDDVSYPVAAMGQVGFMSYASVSAGYNAFAEPMFMEDSPVYTLEDVIRALGTFGGVRSFYFESEMMEFPDEDGDHTSDNFTLEVGDAPQYNPGLFLFPDIAAPTVRVKYDNELPDSYKMTLVGDWVFGGWTDARFYVRSDAGFTKYVGIEINLSGGGLLTFFNNTGGGESNITHFNINPDMPYSADVEIISRTFKYDYGDDAAEYLLVACYFARALMGFTIVDISSETYGNFFRVEAQEGSGSDPDAMQISQLRVGQLTDFIDWASIDVNDTPMAGIRRAVGDRPIEMFSRFDGTLVVRQRDTLASVLTLTDSDIIKWKQWVDRRERPGHIRLVGAFSEMDYYPVADPDLGWGMTFMEFNDSSLEDPEKMFEQVASYWSMKKEDSERAVAIINGNPLLEVGDRVIAKSDDWVVEGIRPVIQPPLLLHELTLRGYYQYGGFRGGYGGDISWIETLFSRMNTTGIFHAIATMVTDRHVRARLSGSQTSIAVKVPGSQITIRAGDRIAVSKSPKARDGRWTYVGHA